MKKTHNLKALLQPKSVAIIGASRNPKKIGHLIFKNIIDGGFTGLVYPVNPKAKNVLRRPAFASVKNIKKPVDLAIIAIPAPVIPQVLKEAGQKRVKTAIIISAGFSESGKKGKLLEKQILAIAKKYQMRILGPNCLGVVNPQIKFNGSWGGITPKKGNIAFISQSGAIYSPVVELLNQSGIGLSYFVSLGNKANISENDLIKFLKDDPQTQIIIAYLESFQKGQQFIKIAQSVSSKKPIIILKSGATMLGAKAAQSHTASLATPGKISDGVMQQANVIKAENLREFLNLIISFSQILSFRKKIGSRVAIVTNAGGPSVLATDAIAKTNSLSLAKLSPQTQNKLKKILSPAASLKNPVDILGDADAQKYQETIKIIAKDPQVDIVLVILTQQLGTEIEKTAAVCAQINKNISKIIIANFMGGENIKKARKIFQENNLTNFDFPQEAVRTLSKLHHWQVNKEKTTAKQQPTNKNQKSTAQKIIAKAAKEGKEQLNEIEAAKILNAYQIKTPKMIMVKNFHEAKIEANKIGYPLFLKIISSKILHKTDVGGVAKIKNAKQLKQSISSMAQLKGEGFVLEEAIKENIEIILGAKTDPSFGHIIMAGAGGIYTEILKDTAFRVIPISKNNALQMLRELRIYPILKGARGSRGVNLGKIERYLLAISQLIIDFPQIKELDFNPVICTSKSAVVVDAKIVLSPLPPKMI